MKAPKLKNVPLIQSLASMQQASESSMKFAGLPRGTIRGIIKDVQDPEDRGRVRVVFDDMNPEIPQVSGAGIFSQEREGKEPDLSHWIDTSPAFKGKQPEGLVGKRVNISVSNGQFQYAILQDVMFDPGILAEKPAEKLKRPNNSSMTRLPIYEAGKLPLPCEENWGCTVVEAGGPYGNDWLCVCLRRDSKYIWVRHSDLQHGHAGGNDTTAFPDTGGDKPQPSKVATVWDKVFVTSANEMPKYTAYGTEPRGNPFGETTQWFTPPMNEKAEKPVEPLPILPATYTDQDTALSFLRDSDGFTEVIPGQTSPPALPPLPSPLSSILPFASFNEAFSQMVKYFQDQATNKIVELVQNATGVTLPLSSSTTSSTPSPTPPPT